MRNKIAAFPIIIASLMLLASCQQERGGPEPESTGPAEQEKFEIVGLVTEVEVEDLDDGNSTPSPAETDEPADDNVRIDVRLIVEVQTINDPASDLCDVQRGDNVEVVINEETKISPVKALADLDGPGGVDDQKISAGGTAELAGATCTFTASSLRVVQGDGDADSPTPSATPADDADDEAATPSPTSTYSKEG